LAPSSRIFLGFFIALWNFCFSSVWHHAFLDHVLFHLIHAPSTFCFYFAFEMRSHWLFWHWPQSPDLPMSPSE
jgi:hypothetical protein